MKGTPADRVSGDSDALGSVFWVSLVWRLDLQSQLLLLLLFCITSNTSYYFLFAVLFSCNCVIPFI